MKKQKITQSKKSVKKQKNKEKVTKNTTFGELMQKYPETAEIMMNKGMFCIGCGMAGVETIEQGAIVHGINPEELIEEINKALFRKESLGRKLKPLALRESLGRKLKNEQNEKRNSKLKLY